MMKNIRKFTAVVTSFVLAISCMVIVKPQETVAATENDMVVMAEELMILINEARAEEGISPLYMVDHLNDIAVVRARELIDNPSHGSPIYGTILNMIDKNRVPFSKLSENIVWGKSSPEEMLEKLMSNSTYRSNIMNPLFTHVGIGMTYAENSSFGWYGAQVFVSVGGYVDGQKMVTRDEEEIEPEEPAQYDMKARAEELLVLFNEVRSYNGLAPLYMVDHLNDIAAVRARELIQKNEHCGFDGGTIMNMLDKELIPYTRIAENIAWGKKTPEDILEILMNSEEHRSNILNPDFTHVGIGVTYESNSLYQWYSSQIFVSVNTCIPDQRIVNREELIPDPEDIERIIPTCCGDLNGDSKVNSFDVIALVKYCFGNCDLTALQLEACDVMQDGSVNIADVVVMRKHIIGYAEYSVLPCPSRYA